MAIVLALLPVCFVVFAGGPAHAKRAAPSFAMWLKDFRADAIAAGISQSVLDRELAGLKPDLKLPDLVLPGTNAAISGVRGQLEFTRAPQDYLNRRQLARLATRGRKLAETYRGLLRDIDRRIGVPADMVLAIWGRETAFGGYRLKHDAVRALATQAYTGRRASFFRQELVAALRLIDDGIAMRRQLKSSWAGAIGLTQFLPSEVYSTAVDFDGNGQVNLWDVTDALASAANQLKHKGWLRDRPWGIEVVLPRSGADCAMAGPGNMKPIADWAGLGLARVDGKPFSRDELSWPAYLLVPGGTHGPVFLVTENYIVIRRYNMSDLYALFVGNLANQIAGRGDFVTPWAKLRQLPTRDLREIQRRLQQAGFAISKIDGMLGSNTRSEIGLYQRSRGLKRDCWPTAGLLRDLRGQSK